jgi:phospholipid/cholesterol/gamma-HCH transport system permease protein
LKAKGYYPDGRITFMHFLEYIGRLGIKILSSFGETFFFAGKVLIKIFNRRSYNSAMRTVLLNQIYFTSVQILPVFLIVSIIFGSVLIGIVFQLLKQLGLTEFFGNVLMGLIVTELSPFFTVLLITLRSSSAISTEMAVMKVNREIKTLETFRIDVINYLLLPRIINGVVSLVLLNSLFSIVLLVSGIIFSSLIFGMSMDVYSNILLNSANFSDIIIALVKCAVFGFFITLIPIRFGLKASQELTSIPVAVSNGMVNVFAAILIIEVLSLITKLL